MTDLTTAPIMRLFQLETYQDKLADFDQVGHHNFSQSLALEKGTLFMAAAHAEGQPQSKLVFELYRDEAAYQDHISSPHFKAFADFAKEGFSDRKVTTLEPQILAEKSGLKQLEAGQDLHLRLARVQVAVENAAAFKAIVEEEMLAAVAKEEGVLALFAGRDQDDLSQWYFIELYKNQAAYEAHRQTAHFKAYIDQSADLVLDKALQVLVLEQAVSQGISQYRGGSRDEA